MEPPYLTIRLKMGELPDKDNPRHKFEKTLGDPPWTDQIVASIELDDPPWELLGYPKELEVNIAAAPPAEKEGGE